jgi:hypothetical protein
MFDKAFGTEDKLLIIISTLLFQPETEFSPFLRLRFECTTIFTSTVEMHKTLSSHLC